MSLCWPTCRILQLTKPMLLATWLLWLWKCLLFNADDNDCIADLSIANLFLMFCVQFPSLVKIEFKYTKDSTSSRTSPQRLIFVLVPLFPHAITFVLSVLISSPNFFTNSWWFSGEVAMSTKSFAYISDCWSLCLLSETLYCSHPKLLMAAFAYKLNNRDDSIYTQPCFTPLPILNHFVIHLADLTADCCFLYRFRIRSIIWSGKSISVMLIQS